MDDREKVDWFFSLYTRFVEHTRGLPLELSVFRSEEEKAEYFEPMRVHESLLSLDDVKELQDRVSAGSVLPDSYVYFLTQYGVCELAEPQLIPDWLQLFSTYRPDYDNWIQSEFGETCLARGLVPFASDNDPSNALGSGFYCIDCQEEEHGTDKPVRFISADLDGKVSAPLTSSFGSFLRIIPHLRDEYTDTSMLDETIVRRIRATDPEVFGGSAWDAWWKVKVLRESD